MTYLALFSNPLRCIIILVFFTILSLFSSTASAQENLSEHPIVIIISFDGFRYDYMSKTDTPNLDKVKTGGVSIPYMQNEFVTSTFPNHHTIATGLFIESHGVIANSFYDPLYGKVLEGKSSDTEIQRLFWNYSSNILPLYTANELAGDGRHSGVMMWAGSDQAWGPKHTVVTHVAKYGSLPQYEDEVDKVISWITDKEKPANLIFLYFTEPDKTGHKNGPEGDEIKATIKRVDGLVGYLMKNLNDLHIQDKVNIIFLSDHGMQEVQPGKVATFQNVMSNDTYDFIRTGSPIMHIIPHNQSETLEMFKAFNESAIANHYTAYLKEDVKPHWHYTHNRRIPPIFLVADLGYKFEQSSSSSTGTHGYDNHEPSMRPFFMATGPLFKNDGSVQKVFNSVDIYPLICHIMGIKPPPNNGSLENVLPLLRSAPLPYTSSTTRKTPTISWVFSAHIGLGLYLYRRN